MTIYHAYNHCLNNYENVLLKINHRDRDYAVITFIIGSLDELFNFYLDDNNINDENVVYFIKDESIFRFLFKFDDTNKRLKIKDKKKVFLLKPAKQTKY